MAESDRPSKVNADIFWPPLLSGEELQWEGRPAPRCYTFRQWRHALFGLFLTVVGAVWTMLGVQQSAEQGWPWLSWVPLPFLCYGLWLAVGQLIAARLEWNRVAYAITDRRVIARRGLLKAREASLPLDQVTWFRLQPFGEELGTLQIRGREGDPVLFLHGIEYPRRPADLLEVAIKSKEQGARSREQGFS